jgi:hypothetical protein
MASDYIKRHKSWQKYAKKQIKKGKKPIAFKHWRTDLKSEGMESVYFRGTKRQTTESRLKKAGLSDAEIERMGGRKSKYKRSR